MNTPVDPNNPHIQANNDDVVNWMVNGPVEGLGYHFALGFNSVAAIYVATSSTPRVTVQQNLSGPADHMWSNVPIDPSWRPGSNGLAGVEAEPDMCIFDADTGREWFFYKCTAPGVDPIDYGTANSLWQARGVGYVDGSGEPGGWQGTGAGGTAGSTTYHDAGMNAGAGKVRAWETHYSAGSDWGHALVCSHPRVCNSFVYPSDFVTSSVTYPTSDTTAVPSGTRFWLPPSYDIENAVCDWPDNTFGGSGSWFGQPLNEVDKQLHRTVAKYGIYIHDQNGSPAIGLGNDNGVVIATEGLFAPTLRGESFADSVMAPHAPRLNRSAVAALKVTRFYPNEIITPPVAPTGLSLVVSTPGTVGASSSGGSTLTLTPISSGSKTLSAASGGTLSATPFTG